MSNLSSIPGIYQITNVHTHECYIGSSKNVHRRLYDHMVDLARFCHINKLLQSSWDEYGPGAFCFSILEVTSIQLLAERELFWIKKMRAVEDGFNIKSDMEKRRTLMKIDFHTKEMLEDLDMGSMNTTLETLLKLYNRNQLKEVHKKHHGK
ncbi:hypothetical protein CL635_03195 [bacterium]|jgi:group I intron endonuclease|nr:hypothetical protein [bacterium]|tara:strand:+ start:12194 stop:12646 length:453 start_codon:yes stop_codon:yes gene_type:complete